MSARIDKAGTIFPLDRRAEPEEQITEQQVQDPKRLARMLMTILRDVALLKRRWWPERIDFEDTVVDATGTTKYRLPHQLGGRVRYWVVQWSGTTAPCLKQHADTTEDVLVLTSNVAGTATIRVEAAG